MDKRYLKKINKRKGGISIVIISLILVLLVLACLPGLKALVNSTATANNNLSQDIVNVTK